MMINTHVEAGKIGRQIAEQVMDSQRRVESPSDSSPDPDPESSLSMPVNSGEVCIESLSIWINSYWAHPLKNNLLGTSLLNLCHA